MRPRGGFMVDDDLLVNEFTYNGFKDAIRLGYSLDDAFLREIKIPVHDLARHTLIVGSTGSGKTTTAAVLASQLVNYGSVLIIDWNDEYFQLLNNLGVNGGLVVNDNVRLPGTLGDWEDFITILDDVLELTDAQAYLLYKLHDEFGKLDELSVGDLITLLESMQPESKWMLETKASLLRKLKMLYNVKTRHLYNVDKTLMNDPLLIERKINIISLRDLRDLKIKRLAALTLVCFIEKIKKLKTLGNVYIVIDEAHNVIDSNLLNRLIAEVRKLGIGFILVTQSPAVINNSILSNCNVRIFHSLKSYADIDIAVKSLGVNELRDVLPRLGVGEAVIDAPSFNGAVRVKICAKQYPVT